MHFSNSSKSCIYPSLLLLCILLCLPACSTTKAIRESESGSFFKKIFSRDTYRIYKIDIQQGNQLTQQQLNRLKPGLTKTQVQYLLGLSITPTLFHNDRWDYVYSFVSGTSSKLEKYRVTLFFEEDRLVEIQQGSQIPE